MVSIRAILREDYPCSSCGARRGEYCHTLRGKSVETDPHQSRWLQYYDDRRRRFAADVPLKRRAEQRQRKLELAALGPPDPPSVIDYVMGPFKPRRSDSVAEWLKRNRDRFEKGEAAWDLLDSLLDDYRLHADTGTPLEFDVHEPGSEKDWP